MTGPSFVFALTDPGKTSEALRALPTSDLSAEHQAVLACCIGELAVTKTMLKTLEEKYPEIAKACMVDVAEKAGARAVETPAEDPPQRLQTAGMDCWGLAGRELVTEYDAKQVEYWLRGFLDKAPPPKNEFDRELTMFMAAVAADDAESRAMGIAWGREVLRKQEPIWHAGVDQDGGVRATKTEIHLRGCALRFDCKLPRNHKGPCRAS